MLRDRVSKMQSVDLALKWCKAKERWIDHVYNNFVNIFVEKEDRYAATRTILGISGRSREFDFDKTVNWENLDDHDRLYWEAVKSWVVWFQANALYIEQDIKSGFTETEMLNKYAKNIPNANSFVKYLITNLS